MAETMIKSRLAVDIKPIKRLFARFKALENAGDEQERRSCAKECSLELSLLDQSLKKLEWSQGVSLLESERVHTEIRNVLQESERAQEEVESLKRALREEEKRKENRIEYDRIAKDIEQYPSREISERAIERLEQEIAMLEEEDAVFEATRAARRTAFIEILHQLEEMQMAIRQEKEMQERKEGLADDDDETEGKVESASGTTSVRASTPSTSTLNPTAKVFEPDTMDTS